MRPGDVREVTPDELTTRRLIVAECGECQHPIVAQTLASVMASQVAHSAAMHAEEEVTIQ